MFPEWPESAYLARMAPLEPQLVHDTVLKIPPTDNFRIHQDFVEAAKAMPPKLAVSLARIERDWIRSQSWLYGLYPENVGELVALLACQNEVRSSVDLSRALLEIRANPRGEIEGFPVDPVAKFDNWHYNRVIRVSIMTALAQCAPYESLILLAESLEKAIEIRRSKDEREESEPPREDYSKIWRPEIAQSRLDDLMDTLVSGVRDAAVAAASTSTEGHIRVLSELKKHPWLIFHRLWLFTLAQSKMTQSDTVVPVLTDSERYGSFGKDHEFEVLLREWFARVDDKCQGDILRLIEKGPNLDDARQRYKEGRGREPTEDELDRHSMWFRSSWWQLIEPNLPPEVRARYEEALNTVRPGQRRNSEVVYGQVSPVSSDELARMDIPELITYLRDFQPTDAWNAPTIEGLSRTLTAIVREAPARYAAQAQLFEGSDPTYVRGVIEGFREAVTQTVEFDWDNVLSMCAWAVRQPIAIPNRSVARSEADPDWSWTRRSIASFLSHALSKEAVPIPVGAKMWQVLEPLTSDADPGPDREENYAYNLKFAASLALNSTRGVALEGAIRLALWFEKGKNAGSKGSILPALERQLSAMPLSFATTEVCSMFFPWLLFLFPTWARQHAARIFPHETNEHLKVAWRTYILFCHPYDEVLEVLREHYERAVNELSQNSTEEGDRDPQRHLVEHLLTFYWRGKLDLAPGGLIDKLFRTSADELKTHALEFIGRSLESQGDEPIPDSILERLKSLWENRVAAVDQGQSPAQLSAFGWWFSSGRFADEWLYAQLLVAVRHSGSVEADSWVVKKLVRDFATKPSLVLTTLHLVVQADKQGWSVYGWLEEAREILRLGISSGESELFRLSKETVDLLVAKGHWDFRALLKDGRS